MLNKYRFKINYKLSGGSLSTFVSPFESALLRNDLDAAKYWISISDINAKDKKGNTYLFYAINSGHLDIVELLINNYYAKIGYEELVAAFLTKKSEIIEYLINKTDINAKDNKGNTYLFYAINSGHLAIVKLLIQKNVDINNINNEGYTALHAATDVGNLEIVEFFINHVNETDFFNFNKFINAVDVYGNTALHIAMNKNMLGIIGFLIKNNANINVLNNIDFNNQTIASNIADFKKNKNYYALAKYLVEKAFGM